MIYRLFLLAITFLFSSNGFSDSNTKEPEWPKINCEKKQTPEPFEQGMPLPCGKYPCAYNAPANICLKNGWDFYAFGSFIYWHASQDDMNIAYIPGSTSPNPLFNYGGIAAYQNFKYEPGFKLGFGFNTGYDNWVFRAEYTRLHESVSTGIIATPRLPGVTTLFWQTSTWFQSGSTGLPAVSSTWRLKLDMVDAVLQRPFYEGTKLTLNPFVGLRALWLRQKLNVSGFLTSGALSTTSKNRSTSWALGPVTGVEGHWLFGYGLRFEGSALGSLLYTRYEKISNNEDPPGTLTPPISSSIKDVAAVRPVAQLNLGLGWGRYFHGCGRDYYLDISLDYEFLEFWSQNMMRSFMSNIATGIAEDIGDLQIHGLTATARFDF